MTLAPEKIILGGGVMNKAHLLQKVREQFTTLMASYMETPPVEEYIVQWGMPNESGIIGSLLLAEKAHREGNEFA